MSDEKQLTVAELLARAGTGSGSGGEDKPRRRRRRNLEEGGVSVAELTGSIPKVEAKPAEARHSSVPLDAEPEDEAPKQPAPAAPTEDGDKKTSTPAAETTTDAKTKPAAAAKGDAKAPDTAKAKDEAKPQPKAKTKTGAEAKTGAQEKSDPAAKIDAKTTDEVKEKPATAVKPAPAKPAAAKSGTAAPAAPRGEEAADEDGKSLPSKEDTAVIDAVDVAEPAGAGKSAQPTTEPKSPAESPAGMAGNIVAAAAVPAGVATGADVVREDAAAAKDTETTGNLAAVEADLKSQTPAGATAVGPAEDVDAQEAEDDEEAMSVGAMLGLAVVGVILGVVVFLVFDQLWLRLPNIVVGIAALVVTGLMVVGVKLLRTVNDGLSMALAGIVGLLMTFGPALIIAL